MLRQRRQDEGLTECRRAAMRSSRAGGKSTWDGVRKSTWDRLRAGVPWALCSVVACAGPAAQVQAEPPSTPERRSYQPIEVPSIEHPAGESSSWWYLSGAARALKNGAMEGTARNLIVFIGDGMGLTTVTAARILAGQREGRPGEEGLLSWEEFPHTALAKTYTTNAQTSDSAGTISAITTGVKTLSGVIAQGAEAARGICEPTESQARLTWLELAASAGLATGIVSTARITHATPAGTYAHAAERAWESDADLPESAREAGCRDIARQLVESRFPGEPRVVLGGGRANFLPQTEVDPEYSGQTGRRQDGRNLIAEWQRVHAQGQFVWNAAQLAEAKDAPALFGLFEPSHMQFEHERAQDGAGEPSLTELSLAALRVLEKHEKGYVLLIESGRIDHAHHAGNAYRALDETVELSRAVQAVAAATSEQDTLLLVTADHSHTLSIAGYPTRGNPILGAVKGQPDPLRASESEFNRDAEGRLYTTLSYANGPGARRREKQTKDGHAAHAEHPDYLQAATVPLTSESHGGEDVPVWARGPGSNAVRGTIEQHVLYHVIVQALPALRERLCQAGTCNEEGVPVKLPELIDFVPAPETAER